MKTYVDAISSALQEYQTGMSVSYGAALQEYKDLAWHGLEKTAIYRKLSQTDRTRIENRFGAESRGGDVGGQKLIGKPCNK